MAMTPAHSLFVAAALLAVPTFSPPIWAVPPVELADPDPNPPAAIGTALAFTPSWVVVGAAPKRTLDAQRVASSRGAVLLWPRLAGGAPFGAPTLLLPPGPKRGERFGESLAVEGNYVAVGSPGYDINTITKRTVGRVTILDCTSTPTILTTILPTSTRLGLEFGAAIAMDQSLLVVGAPGWGPDASGPSFGTAYVFAGSGASWRLAAQLHGPPAPNGTQLAQVGAAVALDDATVVVGAPGGVNLPDVDYGRVYVFDRGDLTAPPTELAAPTPTVADRFGAALACSEGLLAIGAPGSDCDQGAVHVFRRSGIAWTIEATLAPPDGPGWIGFGNSVAIERERVAVGTGGVRSSEDVGTSVAVFRRTGRSWSLEATSLGASADPSGGTVSLDASGLLRTDPLVGSGVVRYVPLPRSADLDFDGQVGPADLGILLGAWGTDTAFADIDADGIVGASDLSLLLGSWS